MRGFSPEDEKSLRPPPRRCGWYDCPAVTGAVREEKDRGGGGGEEEEEETEEKKRQQKAGKKKPRTETRKRTRQRRTTLLVGGAAPPMQPEEARVLHPPRRELVAKKKKKRGQAWRHPDKDHDAEDARKCQEERKKESGHLMTAVAAGVYVHLTGSLVSLAPCQDTPERKKMWKVREKTREEGKEGKKRGLPDWGRRRQDLRSTEEGEQKKKRKSSKEQRGRKNLLLLLVGGKPFPEREERRARRSQEKKKKKKEEGGDGKKRRAERGKHQWHYSRTPLQRRDSSRRSFCPLQAEEERKKTKQ